MLLDCHIGRDTTKPTKCAPSEDSVQPVHPPRLLRILVCAERVIKGLAPFMVKAKTGQTEWAPKGDDMSICWANIRLLVLSYYGSYLCATPA